MQHPVFIAATLALALALGPLSACDSPSPRFAHGEKQEVTVGGSTFSVHQLDDEVEVYRTSFEYLPAISEVFAKAEQAIVIATGCKVREGSMTGDPAIIRARLACG